MPVENGMQTYLSAAALSTMDSAVSPKHSCFQYTEPYTFSLVIFSSKFRGSEPLMLAARGSMRFAMLMWKVLMKEGWKKKAAYYENSMYTNKLYEKE